MENIKPVFRNTLPMLFPTLLADALLTGKVSGACRVSRRCITSLQISPTMNQQKIMPDTCGAAHERFELPVIIAQPAHFDLISIVLIVSTSAPHGPVSEITKW